LFVHSKRLTINSPVTRSGCIERGIFTTLCKQVRDQIMYNLKSNKPYVIQPKMDGKICCQDVVVFSCNVENEMYSKCITLAVMYMHTLYKRTCANKKKISVEKPIISTRTLLTGLLIHQLMSICRSCLNRTEIFPIHFRFNIIL
jgi:hypothetical protein